MLHGQMLHGEMSLDHLSTFKDGPTKLKWPLRYFPWGGGVGCGAYELGGKSCGAYELGGEKSKLMLSQSS